MLIKYKCDSKSQTLRMRYPFQSQTGRPISHRNEWSFCVYMIPLRDFVPEWNSRPGTTTGVNSRRGDSRRHNILWWYHVNKYRAMRGNRSELAPGRKSPRCHLNTPLGPVHRISGYFWIRNFFFPDTAFVQTYPVYPAYEFVTFWICSLEWKFLNMPWIRNRVNAKSGYFFQWHYKIEPSSLPWISKTVPSATLSLL